MPCGREGRAFARGERNGKRESRFDTPKSRDKPRASSNTVEAVRDGLPEPSRHALGDLPGATGGGRAGFEKSTVFPSASGLEHMTNPICPLGYVGMEQYPYCTDPPTKIPLHISSTSLMSSAWSQMHSPCVHKTPPGLSAR